MSWVLRPVAVFAGSRAAVLVALWLMSRLRDDLAGPQVFLFWDAALYEQVIEDGYPERPRDRGIYAFFPLYPMTARGLAAVTGMDPLAAGLTVGAVAGLAAAVVLWRFTASLRDEGVADRTVALFAFFPGSFVLSMLYAEGVMIALAAGCLWALTSRRWLLAGVLAALATASRPNALALVPACAWACAMAVWYRREWRSLVAPVLAPTGFVAFCVLLWTRTGDPLTWFTVQRELWQERVTPLALVEDVEVFLAAPFGNTNTTSVVVGAVLALVGLVLLARARLPGEVTVYALVVLGLAAFSETLGLRPRFVMTAFPLFVAAAVHLRGAAFSAVLGLSATVLGAFTVVSLSTTLFTP